MAFNSRKFQKLIEEEKKNAAAVADEFEDDFADDFADDFDEPAEEVQPESVQAEVPAEEAAEEPAAEEVIEEPAEEIVDEEPASEEPAEEIVEEEPVPEEPAEEIVEIEEAEEIEPEIVVVPDPVIEEPVVEVYDAHKMWQDMAALAIKAKECITAGAFYRASDIISAMRTMLVEMMCRANGINENFNENADYLNDECKQDIYTSYVSVLNEQSLSAAVTNIMAVTYKYV